LLKALIAAVLTATVVLAPFVLGGSGSKALDPYLTAVGQYPVLSTNAFNFWWLVFGTSANTTLDISPLAFGLQGRRIGTVLLALVLLACLATYWWYSRRSRSHLNMISTHVYVMSLILTIVSAAFFMFPTEIHERYSVYILLPLLLAAILDPKKRKTETWIVWLAGVLIWLNLIYVTPFFSWGDVQRNAYGEWVGRVVAMGLLMIAMWCAWRLFDTLRTPYSTAVAVNPTE
jgi:hypothetical protein